MRRSGVTYLALALLVLAGGCKRKGVVLNAPLHRAASYGDVARVQALMADGADINARDRYGRTPLFKAAQKGHMRVVELLVEAKADVDIKDEDGCTALFTALDHQHVDIAKLLIAGGAKVKTKDKGGITPLHRAAETGRLAIVQFLIAKGADIDARTNDGDTPLLLALNSDHEEAAQMLLVSGADVKVTNKHATTPLHLAAGHGHMRLVREVLERGAALNARDGRGRTPAEMAMEEKRTKLVRFLVDRGTEVGIHLAAYLGDVGRVEQLLESGVDVDAKDADGKTALCWTVPENQVAVARVLLANGADVNAKGNGNTLLLTALWHGYDEMATLFAGAGAWSDVQHSVTGETPLEMAAYMGFADVVKVLLNQGADVNATTTTGRKRSAMHRGVWSGSSDVVALLIGHGADLEVRGIHGETPLHAAAGERDPNIARLVIEQGVSLNEKDERGQTPLDWALDRENKTVVELLLAGGAEPTIHAAAYVGHIALTKRLLDNGTDVNQRDQENCTPLYYAALGSHGDVVELLVGRGADVNIRRKGSHWKPTPLHAAAIGGETDIVRLLLSQGADIHAENPGGQEVLHVACRHGHADIAALLIAAGADLNQREELVCTPLRLAGIYGHQDVVELLLSEGADVSQETMGGDITLPIQLQMDRQQVARHIIEACAPYTVIITSPENIRRTLGGWAIDVDDIWIPTEDEVRGLEPVLRSYLEKDGPRRRDDRMDRKDVLRQLHLYHREYAGYIDDETRYVICSMQLDDTHRKPFGDDFRRLFDGGMYVVTMIFDFDARTVAPMVYEWH